MKILFERHGGFAGMRLATTIETDSLPPEQALQLEELVADADFFHLPSKPVASSQGADQFTYQITVETAEQQHTVETSDAMAPEQLQPLIRRLTTLARSANR